MQKSVLIVDDEKDIIDMLKYNLEKEGYKVVSARDGRKAVEQAKQLPDLIVLDVMMPEMDGWEVCKQLKRDAKTAAIPVLFLTAKGTEFDEVLGLELGADDYIVKPVAVRTLLARVKTALRRKENAATDLASHANEILRVDKLEINVPNYTASVGNKEITLTRKEFETLVYLARNRGRVMTREVLLNVVWGQDVRVVDRTVDVHISKIREKLGAYGDYIETVKGVGYRMKA
ncbi:MAG: response regulator transcription factor [Bacteroidetes bacterium]|nr:response regulator transcription factor [Bacteroidota bacterium]MCW5896519.1 response regulator transcription factor [Bacteroidota bacterium]